MNMATPKPKMSMAIKRAKGQIPPPTAPILKAPKTHQTHRRSYSVMTQQSSNAPVFRNAHRPKADRSTRRMTVSATTSPKPWWRVNAKATSGPPCSLTGSRKSTVLRVTLNLRSDRPLFQPTPEPLSVSGYRVKLHSKRLGRSN